MVTIVGSGPSVEVAARVATVSTAAVALTIGASHLDAGAQMGWELVEAVVAAQADGAMAPPEGRLLDPARLSRDAASKATKIWIMWQLEGAVS